MLTLSWEDAEKWETSEEKSPEFLGRRRKMGNKRVEVSRTLEKRRKMGNKRGVSPRFFVYRTFNSRRALKLH